MGDLQGIPGPGVAYRDDDISEGGWLVSGPRQDFALTKLTPVNGEDNARPYGELTVPRFLPIV